MHPGRIAARLRSSRQIGAASQQSDAAVKKVTERISRDHGVLECERAEMAAMGIMLARRQVAPGNDGRIRGYADAIVRAFVVALAVVVAWNAPYAWYWRIAIFLAIMFVLGLVYPAVQRRLARTG